MMALAPIFGVLPTFTEWRMGVLGEGQLILMANSDS
jgi:hypothetical protein